MQLWPLVSRFFRKICQFEVNIYAAYAAFFWILAIFPAMMLLISILQFTPIDPAELQGALAKLVPANLQALVDYMVEELFAVNSVTVLSLSAVTALWSASRGVLSLHKGLNRVYSARETRSSLGVRLRCVIYTLAGLLGTVLLLGLHLLSQNLIDLLLTEGAGLGRLLLRISELRYLVTVAALTLFFTAAYTVFPNREIRPAASLPGAFTVAVLWVVFSRIFSVYVGRFGAYSIYYGSLSVIAMAMLWLYVSIYLFLCGGILNRELERSRLRKMRQNKLQAEEKNNE